MVVYVAVRNRLKYWRHQLQIDSKREFASLIGVTEWSLSRWEHQKAQPSLDTLIKIYLRLKSKLPDLHLEDLIDLELPHE
ncbi:MAG: helix-turn-helix transcriptional regulator [Moorella sp. (in: firmicutes)]